MTPCDNNGDYIQQREQLKCTCFVRVKRNSLCREIHSLFSGNHGMPEQIINAHSEV